jgi:hypothetical protein
VSPEGNEEEVRQEVESQRYDGWYYQRLDAKLAVRPIASALGRRATREANLDDRKGGTHRAMWSRAGAPECG